MRIIKKIATLAMATVMIITSTFSASASTRTLDVNKSVTVNGRTITILAYGNQQSISASTAYTSGAGTISVSLTVHKHTSSNPNAIIESNEDDSKSTPGGVVVTINTTGTYKIIYMRSIHEYKVYIGSDKYSGNRTIAEYIDAN